jgi:hypothetical protein
LWSGSAFGCGLVRHGCRLPRGWWLHRPPIVEVARAGPHAQLRGVPFRSTPPALNYADEKADRLSLEALLVDAVGAARRGVESTSTDQPLLTTDPSGLGDALDVVRRVGGIGGFVGALSDGKHRLTDAELELAREVVSTFTADVDAIRRAVRFYWGRDARRPGSIYVMFDLLGLISVQSRERARQANVVVVGTALLLRRMFAKGEIDRDGLDRLLNAIRELGVKSRAFMAVVEGLPLSDRHYLVYGGIGKLKKMPDDERMRIATEINAFLDAHPRTRLRLGLPED